MAPTIPLTDLHRHLDGNVRVQTLVELGQRHGISLPANSSSQMRPFVQVTRNEPDLVAFLKKLDWMVAVLADTDACYRVAYENVEDVCREGIDHAELRFSPYYMGRIHGLHPQAVTEAVIAGVNDACRQFPVSIKLIGIMSRTFGPLTCQRELEALLACRDKLVAVDLAGDEVGFPGSLFTDHFRRVRDAGLAVTVHAGEAAGAASIWQAIRELGACRIGHGVKAIEDPRLMDFLALHQIGIESCLTSNLHTSTVSDYASHPLKAFLDHGICASINTDDPGVSNITLAQEYRLAAPAAGLTLDQRLQARRNGWQMALLSTSERRALRLRLDAK